MKNSNITCFYHPTSVVIVDDNTVFLENLPDNLSDKSKYILFNSPENALRHLEVKKKSLLVSNDFIGKTDDLSSGKSINVDLEKVLLISQNPDRFDTSLIVIVDHDMPEMCGIEFCSKLGKQYKKIMLTGTADHKTAIKAFNDGVIDKFIEKDDANIFEKIDTAIDDLQQAYFLEISEGISKELAATSLSFFPNPTFQDFLKKIISENHISEYYLLDVTGSFILINQRGEQFHLVIQSNEQIENYLKIIRDNDNAPGEVIYALDQKEKLLCLVSKEDFNQSIDKWSSYLNPAHKIKNLHAHYSLIKRG